MQFQPVSGLQIKSYSWEDFKKEIFQPTDVGDAEFAKARDQVERFRRESYKA